MTVTGGSIAPRAGETAGRHPPPGASVAAEARAVSARPFGWLFWISVAAVAGSIVRALVFTPTEALQGPAQKIFYMHVPAAVTALYLAFALMAVCSVLYLGCVT